MMRVTRRFTLTRLCGAALLGLAAWAGAAPALAQSPQLYELRLPDGYSLIRFVNTLGSAASLRSDFDLPRELGTEPASRVTPYYVVERVEGRRLALNVTSGGATSTGGFTVKPNTFNTVLIGAEGSSVSLSALEDTTEFNQLRTRLTFYNAAPNCGTATLALDPGGQAVLANVPASSMKARTVAPAAARVRTACAGSQVGPLDLGRLQPGQLASVWLMAPAGGTPILFTTRDTIAPPGR